MSLEEFWMNVRSGAAMLAPNVIADSPKMDTSSIRPILEESASWLTSQSVEGFDAQDFDFLPPAERDRLVASVEQFREIASRLDPDQIPDAVMREAALPHFQAILEVLRFDRYADPEAFVIGKKIDQALADRWPPFLSELRYEMGEDVTGQRAIWIWTVLTDDAHSDEELLSHMQHVKKLLEQAVKKLKIRYWPYIRFRQESDLVELAQKGRK